MENRYRRITLDFQTYNEDLDKRYEEGKSTSRFLFINDFRKLLEGTGSGEDFESEILEFLNENNIQGAHREFINKLISVSVPGRLGKDNYGK